MSVATVPAKCGRNGFSSDFDEPGLSKYETVPCLPSGSLCSSIFDPLSALVGASGGVYALIGGYFMNAVVVSCLICYLAQCAVLP